MFMFQNYLSSILERVDGIYSRTLVHERHSVHQAGHNINGHFMMEYDKEAMLRVTLTIPDEEKVEFFEVENPSGETKILSKFEDGMVYFTFTGELETGLWKYRAKIYTDTVIDKDDFVAVDAVLSTNNAPIDITSEVFVSDDDMPKKIYARLKTGQQTIINANVTSTILLPDNSQIQVKSDTKCLENILFLYLFQIELYDNGLGYPDITKYDGVYSGYLPKHASVDGYYSVIVQAQDNRNTFTLKGIT